MGDGDCFATVFSGIVLAGDYRSSGAGSVQKLLNKFDPPSPQQIRSQLRITFFCEVVEGLVPAIPENQFLTPQKPGRLVRARKPQITAQATQLSDSYSRSNNRRFNIQRCLTTDSYTRSNNRRLTSSAVSQLRVTQGARTDALTSADSYSRSNNRRFNIQRCLTADS